MKHIFLSSLTLLFLAGTARGMHSEAPGKILIDKNPTYLEEENRYYLFARIHEQHSIGHISYKYNDNATARMHYLGVASSFQKKGIATALFKACIADIKKRNSKQIAWDVMTLDPRIPLLELVEIYKKIVVNLSDENAVLDTGKPFGPCECQKITMTLKL